MSETDVSDKYVRVGVRVDEMRKLRERKKKRKKKAKRKSSRFKMNLVIVEYVG